MSILKREKYKFIVKLLRYLILIIITNIVYNYIGLIREKDMLTTTNNKYLSVKIIGPVKNQGLYNITNNTSLLNLVNLAGGLNKNYYLYSNIIITNNLKINLYKYIKSKTKYFEFNYFNYIKKKW